MLSDIGKKFKTTGFFSIVGAGTLNKIISFVTGIILVRILSKADYGAYSYALNIINFFVLLNGLGTSSCIVQLCVERGDDERAAEHVYQVACSIGMLWDIVLTVVIVFFALFVPLPVEGANFLLLILAPFPIISLIVALQQERLRSKLMNDQFALSTSVNSVSLLAFSVGGAAAGSAPGLSVGRSLAMLISVLFVNWYYHIKVYILPRHVERGLAADVLKMAVVICLTSSVSQLLVLVGTAIIGIVTMDQELVAIYSTATLIPFALYFLPNMVNTYIAPYFIRHNTDRRWVIKYWAICSMFVGIFCFFLAVVCVSISEWMIPRVFGEQYESSALAFNVLMIAFVVNVVFRSFTGNVLAFHRRYAINFIANVIALLVAIAATFFFVPVMGVEGAAYAYLLAICASSVICLPALFIFAGRPAKHV